MAEKFFKPGREGDAGLQYQLRHLAVQNRQINLTHRLNREKPPQHTQDALYSLAACWNAGYDFGSFNITGGNRAYMRASLQALSHHARTEYVTAVLRRLLRITAGFIEEPQAINVSENWVTPPFGVDSKGLEEIFQFMSVEYQEAMGWGTTTGIADICGAFEQEDFPLFEAAKKPITEHAKPLHLLTIPTAITGIEMRYEYARGKRFPQLALVVNPLE